MAESPRPLTHGDYTVGWICALSKTELVAAAAMLDEEHPMLPAVDSQDKNSYLLGRIGSHNVVIACLPAESTGKVSAATVAKDMLRSFKSVRFGLMVGVGGGAPYFGVKDNNVVLVDQPEDEDSEEDDFVEIRDIRLGDVVISLHSKTTEAVVQYDFGRSVQEKDFVRKGGKLNKPPNEVLNAVAMLQGQHRRRGHKISEQLSKMFSDNPLMADEFQCPGPAKDRLFKSNVLHVDGKRSCKTCCGPGNINLVKRKDRINNTPILHYGTIGSADRVMEDATLRDMWAQKEQIKCFEMEAAGLMDTFPCLVIRGICDYADSHKNKIWQPYAATTAAAYAKELLLVVPGQAFLNLPPIELVGDKIIQKLGTWRQSDEQMKCIQAFRTTAYERQKNLNPEREAETCLWCLDDERFRNWRDKSTSCLLWVTADPGCGKSVLSKALVDERLLDSGSNDTTICYFFFKDTSEDQRSPTCALAALLHQLLKSKTGEKAIKHALPAFRENREDASRNSEVMWKIVQDIALDPECGKIVFLLDALDECQSSEQQNFIKRLKRLEQEQAHLNAARIIRFFITSRPYWDIEKGFDSLISDVPGIRLRGENQSESLRLEIDRVIKVRVLELGKQFTGRAREQLLEGLWKVKNRTYLWLHLIFEYIASKPRIDTKMAQNILRELPSTVEEAYEAILRKSKDQTQAKRLLHIIVAAVRPLSVIEVGIALYITEEMRSLEDLELQETQEGQNQESSTLTHDGTWRHSLSVQKSNFVLAHICICFLRLEEFQRKHSSLGLREIDELTSRYDFLEYSALSWTIHFRAILIPEGHPLIALGVELCDTQANQYLSWQLVYWISFQGRLNRDPFKGMTNLHFASHFGLERVVARILTDPGINVNAKSIYMRTPLWEAVSQGHEAVTGQLLVLTDIEVNAADDLGRTPLWIASSEGYEEIVRQLLAAPGIEVNIPDDDTETPLWRASSEGHEEVVRQLLATPDIDVNLADDMAQTPLWMASISGHETIADQLLAAPGLDINKKNCEGETPLSLAIHDSLGAVLSQLLAHPNIEINSKDSLGRTPLWYASDMGDAAMVGKLLADPRINVNVHDDFGKSALSCARSGGHEAVVRQLLAVPGIIDED